MLNKSDKNDKREWLNESEIVTYKNTGGRLVNNKDDEIAIPGNFTPGNGGFGNWTDKRWSTVSINGNETSTKDLELDEGVSQRFSITPPTGRK